MPQKQQWQDILLELMLAIGHELDVEKQLKQFLPVLLRKLGCKAVGIFTPDAIFYQDYVLVKELPRNAGMAQFAPCLTPHVNNSGQIIASDDSGAVYAYTLSGFGVLCLKHAMLPDIFKNEMRQLCDHLSYTLRACQQHQRLQQSQQELDRFFELSDNLMCIIDSAGGFIKVNPAFLTKLHLSLDDLYTTPFMDFLHSDDIKHTQACLNALNDTSNSTTLKNRFKHKQGHYINLAWDVAKDSTTGHLYATAMDITQQVEIEKKLKQAKLNAEQTAAAKAAFFANMSHEIRTPLNGVLGMLDLVIQQPLNEHIKAQLNTAINSGKSLLAIINDVLDFSKINANKLVLEHIDFNLSDLANEVIAGFEYLAEKKQLTLKLIQQLNHVRWLKGDPYRIKQVLNNLLSNALKFTHHGGVELHVDTKNVQGEIELIFKVKDTGIGLNIAQQQHLFEAFSQADTSTTRHYGGTGLGLAICKELVTLMQGRIEINSEPEIGTTFSVSVKLVQGEAPVESKPIKSVDLAPTLAGVSLLLVEDNEVNRIIAKTILHSFGCSVQEAHNGVEAINVLQQASAKAFSVVIMDCLMPEMDGYEATANIRQGKAGAHWQNVPILALTANAMADDQQRCIQAGMDHYLSKPFTREDLLTHLLQLTDANFVRQKPSNRMLTSETRPAATKHTDLPPTNTEPLWQYNAFLNTYTDMKDLGDDLLIVFFEQLPLTTAQLTRAQQQGDTEQVMLLAHSLKSSAAQLCFLALSAAAKNLEFAAKSHDAAVLSEHVATLILIAEETFKHYKKQKINN